MTRDDAEIELASLLLERRRLARFDLSPSPRVVERIRTLELFLYGVAHMTRRSLVLRYSRPDEVNHNALIGAIRDNPDEATPRLEFADLLQEHGIPGAHIVRAHARGMLDGTRTCDANPIHVQPDRTTSDEYHSSPVYSFTPEGTDTLGPGEEFSKLLSTTHGLGSWLQVYHFGPASHKRGVVIGVNHRPRAERGTGVTHSVHVATPGHLRAVLADVPEPTRSQLLRTYLKRVKNPAKTVDQAAAAHVGRLSRGRHTVRYAGKPRGKKVTPTTPPAPPQESGPGYEGKFLLRPPGDPTNFYGGLHPFHHVHVLYRDPTAGPGSMNRYVHKTFWIERGQGGVHKWYPNDFLGKYADENEFRSRGGKQYQYLVKDGNPAGQPLTPHEMWMVGLPGGEPPAATEQDYRPEETIPEDFYATGRRGAVLKYAVGEWLRRKVGQVLRTSTPPTVVPPVAPRRTTPPPIPAGYGPPPVTVTKPKISKPPGSSGPPPLVGTGSTARDALRGGTATREGRIAAWANKHAANHAQEMADRFGWDFKTAHRVLHHALHRAAVRSADTNTSVRASGTFNGKRIKINVGKGRVPLSRKGPVRRYTLDINETIRQGIENSRRNPPTGKFVQDTATGGVLADALDEANQPHGPFYRNLVLKGDPIRGYTTQSGERHDRPDGPDTINVMDPEGEWSLGFTRTPGTVVVHRRPHDAKTIVPTHTAVLDATALHEWASHPKVSEPLRAALKNAVTHLKGQQPSQMSRQGTPVHKSLVNRHDFLGALKRMASSNHSDFVKRAEGVAKNMGIYHSKALPALHDTPGGSVPGVAQAVYGESPPERVSALAAWINGLLANGPGYSVFHIRPGGPDTLYRFRHDGSGMDVRSKLDRAGITSRIMIPHRRGFDVLVPDIGNKLANNVAQYAQQHGLQVEASPGYFKSAGSATDQGQSRSTFRNTVGRQEAKDGPTQMARKRDVDPGTREQELRSWIESVKPRWRKTGWEPERGDVHEHVADDTARMGFADWLREVTGNTSDPRATVVQNHVDQNPLPKNVFGLDISQTGSPPRPYESRRSQYNGLSIEPVTTDETEARARFVKSPLQASHAIVKWDLALPPRRDSVGRAKPGRRRETHRFQAYLEPNQLHDLIDQLPETHRQQWRDYANRFGLRDIRAVKMARKKGHVWFKLIDAARSALKKVSTGPDYQRLFWHPESKTAHWMSADGDDEKHVKTIHRSLKVPGVKKVVGDSETFPKGKGWVEIPVKRKKAKKYAKVENVGGYLEHIPDFSVPVLDQYPDENGNFSIRHYTPHRVNHHNAGNRSWFWYTRTEPEEFTSEAHARQTYPHLIPEGEFQGSRHGTRDTLTPHEVYLATEGAEGHPENPETAPFEMAIRKEPHEGTHRGVYADYLDEHGRPEDAQKQREIGEHFRGTKFSRRQVVKRYAADVHDVTALLHQLQQPEHGSHMAGLDVAVLRNRRGGKTKPLPMYKFKLSVIRCWTGANPRGPL